MFETYVVDECLWLLSDGVMHDSGTDYSVTWFLSTFRWIACHFLIRTDDVAYACDLLMTVMPSGGLMKSFL